MTVVAVLQAENLATEPGQTVTAEVSLANTGTIVEQFTILMLGDVAAWTEIDPPVVSLFPGARQTITLRFSPPRLPTTPSGEVPFAVKIIPSNAPEESVVEEGAITVGSFNDVGAELLPRVTTGRLTGRQRLAVDSRGNVALPVAITAIDPAEALKFQIRPQKLTTAPGEARFVRMRIKPRQRFWRGGPQTKPYRVQIEPLDEKPLVLDGSLTQKAVLPRWVVPLVGLAAVLVLLWFLVLRPIVKSTAQNANAAALAAQTAKTSNLAAQLAATNASVAALSGAPKPAPTTAAPATAAPTTTTTVPATTTTVTTVPAPAPAPVPVPTATTTLLPVTGPNDGRIEVVAAPGSTARNAIPIIGPGSIFTVTDLILQNVSGSGGRARIQRLIPGHPAEDLLVESLSSLTDQDYRLNTPMVFTAGEQMSLSVDCQANQTACEVGLYFTGPLTQPQPTTTTSIP